MRSLNLAHEQALSQVWYDDVFSARARNVKRKRTEMRRSLFTQVLKYCPKDLQADICVHMNRVVLDSNPAFGEASTGVKRALARNFWICHVAPGDRITHQGESLDVLYFIARGSLEVKQGEAVVGLLGKAVVQESFERPGLGHCFSFLTRLIIGLIIRENPDIPS